MKVGDLVRLLDDSEVHRTNQDINPKSVGIIVETPDNTYADGPLSSAWVKWNGHADWDSMFIEDLEIISASR